MKKIEVSNVHSEHIKEKTKSGIISISQNNKNTNKKNSWKTSEYFENEENRKVHSFFNFERFLGVIRFV